jgi:micrococcal nuclease
MTKEEFERGLYRYKAKCVRVVDGDTLDLDIDLGMFIHRFDRVRLHGIDAPEVRGASKAGGLKTKEFVKTAVGELPNGALQLWIETLVDKSEKYGRLLAKVWFERNGTMVCLNDELCEQKLAERRSY